MFPKKVKIRQIPHQTNAKIFVMIAYELLGHFVANAPNEDAWMVAVAFKNGVEVAAFSQQVQTEFRKQIETLHSKRDEVHKKLHELEQASESAWEVTESVISLLSVPEEREHESQPASSSIFQVSVPLPALMIRRY